MIYQKEICGNNTELHLKNIRNFNCSYYGLDGSVQFLNKYFKLDQKNCEMVIACGYNRSDQLNSILVISSGDREHSNYYNRVFAIYSILSNLYGFRIFHNHPSGELEASEDDISVMSIAINTMNLLELKFLGSVIITSEGYLNIGQQPEYYDDDDDDFEEEEQ